jgi:hypothetical protein
VVAEEAHLPIVSDGTFEAAQVRFSQRVRGKPAPRPSAATSSRGWSAAARPARAAAGERRQSTSLQRLKRQYRLIRLWTLRDRTPRCAAGRVGCENSIGCPRVALPGSSPPARPLSSGSRVGSAPCGQLLTVSVTRRFSVAGQAAMLYSWIRPPSRSCLVAAGSAGHRWPRQSGRLVCGPHPCDRIRAQDAIANGGGEHRGEAARSFLIADVDFPALRIEPNRSRTSAGSTSASFQVPQRGTAWASIGRRYSGLVVSENPRPCARRRTRSTRRSSRRSGLWTWASYRLPRGSPCPLAPRRRYGRYSGRLLPTVPPDDDVGAVAPASGTAGDVAPKESRRHIPRPSSNRRREGRTEPPRASAGLGSAAAFRLSRCHSRCRIQGCAQ